MSDDCPYGTVISQEELSGCPECGDYLRPCQPDFGGQGIMNLRVECPSCDWHAVEEWVHDRTVRHD